MVFGEKTQFAWRIHASHGGDRELMAVEVGPKVGGLMNWRFAVPKGTELERWGVAQSGNRPTTPPKRACVEGKRAMLGNQEVLLYGSGDRLSEGVSAYLVFRKDAMPAFVAFGIEDVADRPGQCNMERITFVLPAEEMRPSGNSAGTTQPESLPPG